MRRSRICARRTSASLNRRQPLRQALKDASIVYGHRILPEELRDGLPAIDRSWGAYGSDTDTTDDRPATGDELTNALYEKWRALGAEEKSVRGQAHVLADSLGAITAEPSVHMVHVSLPHRPWTLSRSGIALSYTPAAASDPAAQTTEFRSRLAYQLHSMQVGAVDVAIGDLVERLRAMPSWKDTLLVVTADHGYSLTPPDLGRAVTERNAEEVYRVPLFIKAPGQMEGEVVDDTAMTIDVLPSIVDLLDAEVDWDFDGHSLYDGSKPHTAPRVSPDVARGTGDRRRPGRAIPRGRLDRPGRGRRRWRPRGSGRRRAHRGPAQRTTGGTRPGRAVGAAPDRGWHRTVRAHGHSHRADRIRRRAGGSGGRRQRHAGRRRRRFPTLRRRVDLHRLRRRSLPGGPQRGPPVRGRSSRRRRDAPPRPLMPPGEATVLHNFRRSWVGAVAWANGR